MAKKHKQPKSTLTQAERDLGKNRIILICCMIGIGLAIAIYKVF